MVRPIIQAFAEAMERKLAENDGVKGEWSRQHWRALRRAMLVEAIELEDAIAGCDSPDAILAEAADVALYAMMIADLCGALPETTDRGRVLVADESAPVTFAPGSVRLASPLCDTREVW